MAALATGAPHMRRLTGSRLKLRIDAGELNYGAHRSP